MIKPIENWKDAYDPLSFALKHGLTLEQAKVVISTNGPSRHSCDIGALAFRRTLDIRKRKRHAKSADG
ncbi:hypothetical protein [Mesorhizobium silamurunense]|uniref:hypothetical protein n=1 Tax=Mesorhizobium silamurunense TaxID=499528 RepID=UPI00178026E7|nr:hypothetical protein [Mesorhizobium silamurunense]